MRLSAYPRRSELRNGRLTGELSLQFFLATLERKQVGTHVRQPPLTRAELRTDIRIPLFLKLHQPDNT